ncbi:MAG: hypothetical protein KIS72_11240 [Luteimonas sp.]|nr:hypothetical protein [Luteimonas sp.]
MSDESDRDREFTVADPDARLRDPADLSRFLEAAPGQPIRIPRGTRVRIDRIREVPSGARQVALFVHATPADDVSAQGWTSAFNLEGGFLSETLGRIDVPPGSGRYGPHAVWVRGDYKGAGGPAARVRQRTPGQGRVGGHARRGTASSGRCRARRGTFLEYLPGKAAAARRRGAFATW